MYLDVIMGERGVGYASGSGASARSVHRIDAEQVDAEPSAPQELLPTTLKWSRLWASTLDIMDDAMGLLEEDSAREEPRRQAAAAIRREAVLHGAHALSGGAPSAHAGAELAASQASKRIGRAALDETAVIQIFLAKLASAEARGSRSGLSAKLGEEYGVTSKCVRDIWKMRTWKHVTLPYWKALSQHPPAQSAWPASHPLLAAPSSTGAFTSQPLLAAQSSIAASKGQPLPSTHNLTGASWRW